MPPEIILVLLALMAIATIAVGVSRARRRRSREGRALPGERQLAWLGDRIDDSVGMWALRSLLGRGDRDDRAPSSGLQAGTGSARDGPGRDHRQPQPHREVDTRGRLWRDATIVLLVFGALAMIVGSFRSAGLFGGVAGVTATPEGSLPFTAIGPSANGAAGSGPVPPATSRPAARPTPSRISGPTPTSTSSPRRQASTRPTSPPTPRPTARPTPRPTPTPTPAPPIAVVTVSLLAACTVDAPASYSFTGAASVGAVSYAWTFTGGITGSTAPTVTRDLPGSAAGTTYTITLTVESSAGASDGASTDVTVTCP